MKKIIYSLKKDEILYEDEKGQIVDFAGNTWDKTNRFFKAMFSPVFVVAKPIQREKKETKSNEQKNNN